MNYRSPAELENQGMRVFETFSRNHAAQEVDILRSSVPQKTNPMLLRVKKSGSVLIKFAAHFRLLRPGEGRMPHIGLKSGTGRNEIPKNAL
jgi:hypothetical protein